MSEEIFTLKLTFKIGLAIVIAMGIFASRAPDVRAAPFIFTAIPDQDEARLRKRFDKIALYLEKQLGVKTKYVPVKSYAAAVTAFRNNQVQLALSLIHI